MKNSEFQEEWLSAYLDGELDDRQREIVESRLASDPTARVTLEDLNRVRQMVAKLPAWNGANLPFQIPATNGPTEEIDEELNASSESSTRHDFSQVSQSLDDDEEIDNSPVWQPVPQPKQFPLAWLATAASTVLLIGLGSVLWNPFRVFGPTTDTVALKPNTEDLSQGPDAALVAQKQEGAQTYSSDRLLEKSQLETTRVRSHNVARPEAQKSQGPETEAPQSAAPSIDRFGLVQDSPASTEVDSIKVPAATNEIALEIGPITADTLGRKLDADGTSLENLERAPDPLRNATLQKENLGQTLSPQLADKPSSGPVKVKKMPAGSTSSSVRFGRSAAWTDEALTAAASTVATLVGIPSETIRTEFFRLNVGNGDGTALSKNGVATGDPNLPEAPVLFASVDAATAQSDDYFTGIIAIAEAAEGSLASSDFANALPFSWNNNGQLASERQNSDIKEQKAKRSDAGSTYVHSIVLFVSRSEAEQILDQLKQSGKMKGSTWSTQRSEAVSATPPSKKLGGAVPDTSGSLGDQPVILLLSREPR